MPYDIYATFPAGVLPPGSGSVDKGHTGSAVVQSISWQISQTYSHAAVSHPAKAKFGDVGLVIAKSPFDVILFSTLAAGKFFATLEIDVVKAGLAPVAIAKYKLTRVGVTSVLDVVDVADEVPMLKVTFEYETIVISGISQTENGSSATPVTAGWNLGTNKPIKS